MKFVETPLPGAFLIDLDKHGDERGFFARMFCADEFAQFGLAQRFVQANNSLSVMRGTLRGMHYQLPPDAETKLVRCIAGALLDVIVDIRPESDTFGESFQAELTQDNRRMMYVPKGFAHGFLTLADDTEAFYLVDAAYAPQSERGIRWDDPSFSIDWPFAPIEVSKKDSRHPDFDRARHMRELDP